MSEVQTEHEEAAESESNANGDTETETGGSEPSESLSEDDQGEEAPLGILLREIRRIELGSPVGRASVYPGMFITAVVGIGGIQFEYAPNAISLNTSLGVASIGVLLLYFLLDVTVAYYFVPKYASQ